MSVADKLRLPLERAFDRHRRLLGRPVLYAIPWQTPSGATYDADVDAWLSDADGSVVTKTPSELTSTAIPALWGADAEALVLALGGVVTSGDLVAIARATYQSDLDGAMEVVTGSLTGDRYTVADLENAPDGSAAMFVVATLNRRES